MSEKQYCYCHRCRDICLRCHCNKGHKRNNDRIVSNPSNINTFNPSITINIPSEQTPGLIGVETFQYIALAEEGKSTYTNNDALKQYGSSDILNPNNVSNVNLFVNGVLQPPAVYDVKEGILTLKSNDLPPKDAPIILLFVIVKG